MADTTFTVTTDIEAILGKVSSQDIAKKLNAKIRDSLKGLKDVDLSIGVKALPKDLQKEIQQFVTNTDRELSKAAAKLKNKQELTNALRQELESATNIVDKQGRILTTKLQKILEKIAKARGLSENVTSSRSSLNQFLQVGGKGLVQALQQLETAENSYGDAVEKVNKSVVKKQDLISKANNALKTSSSTAASAIREETRLIRDQNKAIAEAPKRSASQALGQKAKQKPSSVAGLTTSNREDTSALKEQSEALRVLNKLRADAALGAGKFVKATEKEIATLLKLNKTTDKVTKSQARLLKERPDLSKAVLGVDQYISALTRMDNQTKAATEADRRFVKGKRDISAAFKDTTTSMRQTTAATKAAAGPIKGLAANFDDLKKAFRSFIRFAVEYRILFSVLQAAQDLVGGIVSLQDALVNIRTITRATPQDMETVEAAIKSVATTTQFSTDQIAEAAQVLAQAGVAIGEISQNLAGVAQFAAATNTTLKTSADLISTVKNVFTNLGVDEIADQLTNVVNISKITPEGLNTILSRSAQVGKANNIASDQLLAAVGVLRNVGIKDSTISTGFRQALLEVLNPDVRTLKALEKRYAEIGVTLSQDAIKGIFQNFKEQENPLVAALDELAKLGFGGSSSGQFSRVFNIRAENVIEALVDNRNQLISNENAINSYGTALQGAENQLKSLPNALSNLGATITVVTSDLTGGLVDGLAMVVNKLTEVTKKVGSTITEFKSFTGTTGALTSSITGILSAGSALSRGKGIFKALGIGGGAAVVAEGATVGASSLAKSAAGETVGSVVSTIIQGALIALSAKDLVKGGVSKVIGKLSTKRFKGSDKLAQGLSAAATEQARQFSAVDKATGAVSLVTVASQLFSANLTQAVGRLTGFAKLVFAFVKRSPLGALLTVLTAIATSKIFGDLFDSADARAEALGQQFQTLKLEAEGLESQLKAERNTEEEIAKIRVAASDSQEGIQLFFNKLGVQVTDQVESLVSNLASGNLDIKSSEFQRNLEELQEAIGVTLSGDQINSLVTSVRKVDISFANFEATRTKLLGEVQAALLSGDEATAAQQALASSFLSLTASEKAVFQTTINTLEEQETFNNSLDKLGTSRVQQLQAAADAVDKSIEEVEASKLAAEIESAITSENFTPIAAALNQAIQDGAVDQINALKEELESQTEEGIGRFVQDFLGLRSGLDQLRDARRGRILEDTGLTGEDFDVALQTARDNSIDKINSEAEKAVTELKNNIAALTKSNFEGMAGKVDDFTSAATTAIQAIEATSSGTKEREAATKEAIEVIKNGTALQKRTSERQKVLAEKVVAAQEQVQSLEAQKLILTSQEVQNKQQLLSLELAGKKDSAEYIQLLKQQNALQIQFNKELQGRLQRVLASAVLAETGEDSLGGASIQQTLDFFDDEANAALLQVSSVAEAFSSLVQSVGESNSLASQFSSTLARSINSLESLPEVGKALATVEETIAKITEQIEEATRSGDSEGLRSATEALQKARAEEAAIVKKQSELETKLNDDQKKAIDDKVKATKKQTENLKEEDKVTKTSLKSQKDLSKSIDTASDSFLDLIKNVSRLTSSFDDARKQISGVGLEESDVDDTIRDISKLSGEEAVRAAQQAISDIKELQSSGQITRSEALSKLDDAERASTRSVRREAQGQQQQTSQQNYLRFLEQSGRSLTDQQQQAINETKQASIEASGQASQGVEGTEAAGGRGQDLNQAAAALLQSAQQQSQSAASLQSLSSSLPNALNGSGTALKSAAMELKTAASSLTSAASSIVSSSSSGNNQATESRDVEPNSNPVSDAVANQTTKTPVEINVEGAKMKAESTETNIKQFRRSVGLQNLKQGSRG